MKIVIKSKKHGVFICEIDDEDYPLLNGLALSIKKSDGGIFYVRVSKKLGGIGIHRLIMGNPNGFQIDHIDTNPLNNKKSNLRVVTQEQNNFNRALSSKNKSGFKGVRWVKDKKAWSAALGFKGKRIWGGYFDCKNRCRP